MSERRAVTKAVATRYRRADRSGKKIILDESYATTRWHRDHARKALRLALRSSVMRPQRPRVPVYGEPVIAALRLARAVTDAPAGKWMATLLPEIVDRCAPAAIWRSATRLLISRCPCRAATSD